MQIFGEWEDYTPSHGPAVFDCAICGEGEAEMQTRLVSNDIKEGYADYHEYRIICESCGRKSGIHVNTMMAMKDWKKRNAGA